MQLLTLWLILLNANPSVTVQNANFAFYAQISQHVLKVHDDVLSVDEHKILENVAHVHRALKYTSHCIAFDLALLENDREQQYVVLLDLESRKILAKWKDVRLICATRHSLEIRPLSIDIAGPELLSISSDQQYELFGTSRDESYLLSLESNGKQMMELNADDYFIDGQSFAIERFKNGNIAITSHGSIGQLIFVKSTKPNLVHKPSFKTMEFLVSSYYEEDILHCLTRLSPQEGMWKYYALKIDSEGNIVERKLIQE